MPVFRPVTFLSPKMPSTPLLNLLMFDQFTDTNGTALTAHTIAPANTVSAAWTAVASHGTFQIQSNTAQPNTNAADDQIQFDSTKSDIAITANVVVQSTSSPDIMLRWTDATHLWLIDIGTTQAIIYENTGSGYTSRASGTYSSILGVSHAAKVVASGTNITFYLDGTQICTYGSATSNQTATKVGLRIGQVGGGTGCSWDNFTVTNP